MRQAAGSYDRADEVKTVSYPIEALRLGSGEEVSAARRNALLAAVSGVPIPVGRPPPGVFTKPNSVCPHPHGRLAPTTHPTTVSTLGWYATHQSVGWATALLLRVSTLWTQSSSRPRCLCQREQYFAQPQLPSTARSERTVTSFARGARGCRAVQQRLQPQRLQQHQQAS
jgi:hypothetical protein